MTRIELMQNIESLLQQLNGDCDPQQVRNAIADLIAGYLQAVKGVLGYWETTHCANAIAALALNAGSLQQPTTAWLRLSLVDLEKVLVPESRRHESILLQDQQHEPLTGDQLMEAIESIRQGRASAFSRYAQRS